MQKEVQLRAFSCSLKMLCNCIINFILDLTGSQDGSVQMWEWGHAQPVSVPRSPGTFAKVTRVRFSEHGNKFGVADGDGNLSLWQIGLQANASRPFFVRASINFCSERLL